ncbi:sigma-70 family RNA polymerase sigma factor [Halobacillus litoralis]|uniref:sigma-70 family RNA polymerase sigma factor n=1 Tax=Halobacillus litoralis TaxID=45668 RepID=UPI001CFC5C90|nr:sigma-70 family RNA polymerase sigma factor [Halobacillus litoralis]
MMKDETFERIAAESERLIYYHIKRLHIDDRNGDFFAEGLVALWEAYRTYDEAAGSFHSYINWKIRNALIDLIRRDSRKIEVEEEYKQRLQQEEHYLFEDETADHYLWEEVRALLSKNQWKWVYHFIIMDRSISQIACLENVTTDAVKNWGRHARNKLKDLKHIL